ncbi:MAG: hypothetical protein J07HQW1_01752 [Haloquadratum walsbyi J07HQW1]|uniref:Uncharacterized protein n=1 Tax=Haloquadratum walsbyi J07HQW1 TaxID=1238424 RepID=U1N5K6_9EURY|nr:MAG: hypothetical protein J07HQW1_01752 [Haloquadratum walsbyi J07HQW1]
MQRRQFMTLAGVGLLSATGAGCLLRPNPQDAVVNIAPASVDEDASAVLYADLPQAEQEIVRTTLTEGFYHVCEVPGTLRSFARRFGPEDSAEDSYLIYKTEMYGLWIRITDTLRVSTAPSPDENPSCGLL